MTVASTAGRAGESEYNAQEVLGAARATGLAESSVPPRDGAHGLHDGSLSHASRPSVSLIPKAIAIVPVAVSLVIPLYNEEQTVDRLLQSVAAQTRRPDEVICVDAGSTDATAERVSRYQAQLPLRVLRLGRLNPGEARNAGVAEATSDWLAFTDGGITLDSCWLERLLKEIGGDVEAAFGTYEPVCDTPFTQWAALAYVPARGPHGIRGPTVASLIVARRTFDAVGGFPPWRASEDLVFLERLLEHAEVAYAPESVVHWEIGQCAPLALYAHTLANLKQS
jgi:glycosyltransferase involved in cell wall biosynthesis